MHPAESLFERVVRFVVNPSRHVPVLIVLAYVAAVLGLGVAFFGGIGQPGNPVSAVGIVLLGISFGTLFYVSLTMVTIQARHR